MFKGSFVAMVTPFTESGKVDEKGINELVEFHIKNGTDGIVLVELPGNHLLSLTKNIKE